MCDNSTLEKLLSETNQHIINDFERISKIWNNTKLNLEINMRTHLVEKLLNQELIDKSFAAIKKHLKLNITLLNTKDDQKYLKYYENMKKSFLKAKDNLEKANNLKKSSFHRNNLLEVAMAYSSPFLGYITDLSESIENQYEKSILLSKMAWYYHRKALFLQKKLEFKAMPNFVLAKKLYYQAYEINNKNYDAVHGLAKCMYKLSKFKTCIEFLTEEFNSDDEINVIRDYHRMLAICYRKTSQYDKAKKEILLAIKCEPNNQKLNKENNLIENLLKKKKTENYEDKLFFPKNEQKSHNKSNEKNIIKNIEQQYIYRNNESKQFRILSVDGGGIRGIIPAYWACEIEKRAHKPIAHLFNMLAGTSTGGIISAGLSFPSSDGYSPKYRAYELLDVYRHRGKEIFPIHNLLMDKLNTAMSVFGSKYEDKGRKNLFEELLGETKLSSSLTELVIPAANEEFILSTHLFNRFDARYDEIYNDYYVDALMSTSAGKF
jgi:tetratricopeptide (TPR) repeat protein